MTEEPNSQEIAVDKKVIVGERTVIICAGRKDGGWLAKFEKKETHSIRRKTKNSLKCVMQQ